MSEDKREDRLITELDSLKGLLETDRSDLADSIDGLRMSAGKSSNKSDDLADALPEEFLRGWGNGADELDDGPGTELPNRESEKSSKTDEFLPDAYLVEVTPERPATKRHAESTSPESPPPASKSPEQAIPTLQEAVETKRERKSATAPEKTRGAQPGKPVIPVLDQAVTAEDIRQKAPDALGATSWEELEAIVDLLVERRVNDMRDALKKELLGELERQTGLE